MASVAPRKRLSVEEFLSRFGGREGRRELVDGVPVMMAGATRRHARVMRNLLRRIAERLDGTGCEVFAADMGVKVSEHGYRLPDIAVFCDPRDLGARDDEPTVLEHPRVLIEIVSPSTEKGDHLVKLDEYQRLPSVEAIVFVYPDRRAFTTFERQGDNAWLSVVHAAGQALRLRPLDVVVPAEEIFAGL